MSSSEDGQLGLDSIKEQDEASVPPPHMGNGNAYNPYDPDFAPIDGSAEIRIAAMGSTSTSSSTTSRSTTDLAFGPATVNGPSHRKKQFSKPFPKQYPNQFSKQFTKLLLSFQKSPLDTKSEPRSIFKLEISSY